jgi:hypothetical protein
MSTTLPRPVRRALRMACQLDTFARHDPLAYRERIRAWLDANGQPRMVLVLVRVRNGADGSYTICDYAYGHPLDLARATEALCDEAEGAVQGVRFEPYVLPPIADDNQRDIVIA